MRKIFKEYGLDFDNNKYGVGRSIEIEYPNGKEFRTKENIKLINIHSRAVRIWIFKRVLIISRNVRIQKKNRHNFKIVYSFSGDEIK